MLTSEDQHQPVLIQGLMNIYANSVLNVFLNKSIERFKELSLSEFEKYYEYFE
jgi:hypothetical protein